MNIFYRKISIALCPVIKDDIKNKENHNKNNQADSTILKKNIINSKVKKVKIVVN
jgi:hypothetical protein